MKIAVIGAGTSGLSAAAFLKRSGHEVTLYERFESPRPIGAGLMLQPTGLAVLARLGLDKRAIEASSRIYGIQGHVAKTGRTIFNVFYRQLAPHYFGLGIYRGTLFSLLHDEVTRLNVPVVTSTCIEDVEYELDRPFITDGKNRYGPLDLVINAQGARSRMRSKFTQVIKDKPYPYGAVWGVCKDREGVFKNMLYQRYQKARHMIGVMPMGKLDGEPFESVAFFWSLRAHEYNLWREGGMQAWQDEVIYVWPEVGPLVRQFKHPDDLNFATYGDVVLRKCYNHRLVFIGDAAHAASPQLGQGANMGLLDALILDECLRQAGDIEEALKSFDRKRKNHVRFYQTASHWLTPFFQSDSTFMPLLRDATFNIFCKLPYIKTEMVRTLAGVKTGLFTHMNPGSIHPDYDKHCRPLHAGAGDSSSIAAPLYRRILGDAWHTLPTAIRQMHELQGTKTVEGLATIERGKGRVAAWIADIFGFPQAGDNIPVQVNFSLKSGKEHWLRRFAGKSFLSVQSEGAGRYRHLICERFGILTFGLAVVVEDNKLRLFVRRWSVLGLPLPHFLTPGGESYEIEKDGKFNFHVEIHLPVIGLLVKYQGWLAAM